VGKPNYQHEKRQKDLAKRKKQEEKRLRKMEKKGPGSQDGQEPSPAEGEDRPVT